MVLPFKKGDTVITFTDGLIERRSEDIDVGQRRLTDECPRLMTGDLTEALSDLVDAVRDHTREDDIAAVAARRIA